MNNFVFGLGTWLLALALMGPVGRLFAGAFGAEPALYMMAFYMCLSLLQHLFRDLGIQPAK